VSLFCILSIFEILSISIIYPLVNSLSSDAEINTIDLFFFKKLNSDNMYFFFSCLLIVVFLIKNIFSYFIKVKLANYSWMKLIDLRKELAVTYIKLNYEKFLDKGKVDIVTSINDYSRSSIQGLEAIIKLIGELLILSFIAIYLLYIDFNTTIIILAGILILLILYLAFFSNKIIKIGSENLDGEKMLNKSAYSLFTGFKEIKVLKKELFFIEKLTIGIKKISLANITNQKIGYLPKHILEVMVILFGCLYIIFSINHTSNVDIIAKLSVFAFAALRILPGVSQIAVCINDINFSVPPTNKIYEDIKLNKKKKIKNFQKKENLLIKNDFQKLEIRNINFKYKSSNKITLKNINLEIFKNDFVGIIGSSGAGKSSLIDLILGFLEQDNGQINAYSKNNVLIENRDHLFSYLSQEPTIIDGTIRQNITFTDTISDDRKINEALVFSDLYNFVKSTAGGLDAVVGEKGIGLSIGQRQRIALARCHYFDKEIMILDEPSSALDEKTQGNVFSNLQFLSGKKTIIVITHNKNTLRFCNKIYEIENQTLNKIND